MVILFLAHSMRVILPSIPHPAALSRRGSIPMRTTYLLGCFAVLVCLSAACRAEPAEGKRPPATRSVAAVKQAAAKPENLGTRKSGDDWPQFLGPTGDSKSAETGILTAWPKSGPKRVWVKAVGTGYGMPRSAAA